MTESYSFNYPEYFRIIHDRDKELIAIPIYEDGPHRILDFTVKVKKGVDPPSTGLYDRCCFDFPIRLVKALMEYEFSHRLPERETRIIIYIGI